MTVFDTGSGFSSASDWEKNSKFWGSFQNRPGKEAFEMEKIKGKQKGSIYHLYATIIISWKPTVKRSGAFRPVTHLVYAM